MQDFEFCDPGSNPGSPICLGSKQVMRQAVNLENVGSNPTWDVCPNSLVVMTLPCHGRGPSSILGWGVGSTMTPLSI